MSTNELSFYFFKFSEKCFNHSNLTSYPKFRFLTTRNSFLLPKLPSPFFRKLMNIVVPSKSSTSNSLSWFFKLKEIRIRKYFTRSVTGCQSGIYFDTNCVKKPLQRCFKDCIELFMFIFDIVGQRIISIDCSYVFHITADRHSLKCIKKDY